jgi:hypothetical protein
MQKTQPLYCFESVFAAPLHSNGGYSIIVCVFIAAGIRLPSRCLAVNVYSISIIPAFGRHITLCTYPTTRLLSPEDNILHSHFRENFKSHKNYLRQFIFFNRNVWWLLACLPFSLASVKGCEVVGYEVEASRGQKHLNSSRADRKLPKFWLLTQ